MSPVSWGDIFTLPLRGDRIMELRHAHPLSLTVPPRRCRVPPTRYLPSTSRSKEECMSFRRALWALAVVVCLAAPIAVQAQGDYLDVFVVKVKPEKQIGRAHV